jgi:hypothetical protein
MSERITIELLRDEWIALVAAAFYGSDVLESSIGGYVAEVANRLVDQLKAGMGIESIRDEALKMEILNQPVTHVSTAGAAIGEDEGDEPPGHIIPSA